MDILGLIRTELAAAKVRLYQSTFLPTPASIRADFIAAEADFTGYASVTLGAWSAVALDSSGTPTISSTSAFFQATDAVSPNQIGGLWVETAGGVLEYYYPFPTPVNMQTALAFIDADLYVQYALPGFASVEF